MFNFRAGKIYEAPDCLTRMVSCAEDGIISVASFSFLGGQRRCKSNGTGGGQLSPTAPPAGYAPVRDPVSSGVGLPYVITCICFVLCATQEVYLVVLIWCESFNESISMDASTFRRV